MPDNDLLFPVKFLNIQIRSLQYQSFEKTIDLRLEGKSIRLKEGSWKAWIRKSILSKVWIK